MVDYSRGGGGPNQPGLHYQAAAASADSLAGLYVSDDGIPCTQVRATSYPLFISSLCSPLVARAVLRLPPPWRRIGSLCCSAV